MISVFYLSEVLIVLVPVLMTIAFVTIAERKVMAAMQRRCGPNAVGIWGVLQPFADALKLLVKEIIRPRHSNSMLFVLGPCITLTFALLGWAIIPFGEGLAIFDFELGVFFALAVSSLGGYGILISGWSANSKYAFLGAIRATAQLLSYELVFSSIVLILILFSGSFSLTYIVECQQAVWNIFPLMPISIAFFIAILAETNRPPFDLAEAESELVAGLCELWLNFFLFSTWVFKPCFTLEEPWGLINIYKYKMVNGHLYLCITDLNKSLNTISWVLGLMQYRNNNLYNIIGIISDLYCMLVEYVNKIINPLNGKFCYKIGYYNIIYPSFLIFYNYQERGLDINILSRQVQMVYLILFNNKLYTWTSKITDPSERYTPCIEIFPFGIQMEIYNINPYCSFSVNKGLIIFYKSKPGNPIFNSLSLNAKYNKSYILECILEIGKNIPIINKLIINYKSIVPLSNKVIISNGNDYYLKKQYILPEFLKKINEGNLFTSPVQNGRAGPEGSKNNKKRKIIEKNKTKSRSNKWKYIISEKSRKHIILGCEGKTYLEKLKNSWWNYYIIRKCNTSEILYEYHSPCGVGVRLLYSRFKPPYEEFPDKINEFLNYSDKFQNYNLENTIGIINDNKIDEYTELYLYFNNILKVKETNDDYFKSDYYDDNEPKYIESNLEQYYSFCNNKNVYVGWVSIIRINNYSAQPTYYNNLIKRYHKEWVNMLKYWVDVPNNNLKWNSNTKIKNASHPYYEIGSGVWGYFRDPYTDLLSITTNKDVLPCPFFYKYSGIRQNKNDASLIKSRYTEDVYIERKCGISSNFSNEPYLFDPFIPKKYQHKFNYVKIIIKNITNNDDLYNKYKENGRAKNKLPWGIKELIIDHVEKNSREFVKIRPKFK